MARVNVEELVTLAHAAYRTALAAGAPPGQARVIAAVEAGQVGDAEPLRTDGTVDGDPRGLTPEEYETAWAAIIDRAAK